MSFTIKVKEELISTAIKNKYQLAAIIKLSGSLGLQSQGLTLSITTENAKIARYLYELLATFYQVKSEIRIHQKTNLKKNRVYHVFLDQKVEDILADLRLADGFFGIETGIDKQILENENAARAYLCGSFLASGTVKDPEKGKYQLEIASIYRDHAEGLASLMRNFLLDAKTIERKKGTVTYLQRAEDIMDFFIIIGAMQAKDTFESVKILRETRNEINRTNNVETANIARTVSASMRTINNIAKISNTIGIESLPIDLQEVARLRLSHPDYSLQQIADHMPQTITKSGINHRLRKINKFADEL